MGLEEGGFGLLPVILVQAERLQSFQCGKDHLDTFLRDSAAPMHKMRLGLTTVVFHEDYASGPVGYFTLANDAIPLKDSERYELGLEDVTLSAFPAVKLGRLAVARELQGQGVGQQIMDLVFGEILDSQSLSASRLVVVDADNERRVLNFYEKLGFEKSLWAADHGRNHGGRANTPAAIKMHRDLLRALQDENS